MRARRSWIDGLPVLRLTPEEFGSLLEYSASMPSGTKPGKRWRRLDGAYDREFIAAGGVPRWVIGGYGDICPGGRTIATLWFRPVISLRASTVAPIPFLQASLLSAIAEREGVPLSMLGGPHAQVW